MAMEKSFFETVDDNIVFDDVVGTDSLNALHQRAGAAKAAADVAELADQLLLVYRPQQEDITGLVDTGPSIVIHGDSFLLETLSYVDASFGGQPAHAAFMVERRLQHLLDSLSSARVTVIFFDSLIEAWAARPRLLAIRQALALHLQVNVRLPRLTVERFNTISGLVDAHLAPSQQTTVVVARAAPLKSVADLEGAVLIPAVETHARVVAAAALSRTHPCVFWETIRLNGTHCIASTARPVRVAMRVPSITDAHIALFNPARAAGESWLSRHAASLPVQFPDRKINADVESIPSLVTAGALASLLTHAAPGERPALLPLCKLFVLHIALLHFSDATVRAQRVLKPNAQLVAFVDRFSSHFVAALHHFFASPKKVQLNLIDWVDGRLFHSVAVQSVRRAEALLAQKGVLAAFVARMWSDVVALAADAGVDASFEPVWPASGTPEAIGALVEELKATPVRPKSEETDGRLPFEEVKPVSASIAAECDLPALDEDDFEDEEGDVTAAAAAGDDDELVAGVSSLSVAGAENVDSDDEDEGGLNEEDDAAMHVTNSDKIGRTKAEQRNEARDATFQRRVAETLLGALETEAIATGAKAVEYEPPAASTRRSPAEAVAALTKTWEEWRQRRPGKNGVVADQAQAAAAVAMRAALLELVTWGEDVPAELREKVMLIAHNLGFEKIVTQMSTVWRAPAPAAPPLNSTIVRPSMQEIQLRHLGTRLPREKNPHDKRLPFQPDEWQRRLLDIVDRNESAVVCAPSSAGKTFIATYCLRRVLYESDRGVAVFVVPILALANQVYAELQARFSKRYSSPNQHMVGILSTGKTANVETCQLLVCTPDLLEPRLLSPAAAEWVSRIRYYIFDEVHCINSPEGDMWERMLLLARSPFLALSATIGSPKLLEDWLSHVHADVGKVHFVETKYRFNDLKKHVYLPMPKKAAAAESAEGGAADAAEDAAAESASEAPAGGLLPVHSLALFTWEQLVASGLPSDIFLPPDEALQLYAALKQAVGGERIEALAPERYFDEDNVTRNRFIVYQHALIDEFVALVKAGLQGPVEVILDRLRGKLPTTTRKCEEAWQARGTTLVDNEFLEDNIAGLLKTLRREDKLPVIIFSFSAARCDRLLRATLKALEEEEEQARADAAWQRRLRDRQAEEEKVKKARDALIAKSKRDLTAEQLESFTLTGKSSADMDRDMFLRHAYVSPDERLDDSMKADVQRRKTALKRRHRMADDILRAFDRGIAVHHRQVPTQYRRMVEMLFRLRHLRVIFATGTLSLGVNMPCRTVVFAGDGLYVDSVNYRQMGGRAGRRGQDDVGHVVFFGVPDSKTRGLLTTSLASFKEARPLQAGALYSLLHQYARLRQLDKDPEAIERARAGVINLVTKTMSVFIHGDKALLPSRFFTRYLIDFYRRQGAMDVELCGTRDAVRMSQLGEAQFVLVQLFRSGVLQTFAAAAPVVESVPNIILLCAHLFGRKHVDAAIARFAAEHRVTRFAELPPLPDSVLQVIDQVDSTAMRVFSAMAAALISEIVEDEDEDEEEEDEEEDEDKPDPSTLPLSDVTLPVHGDAMSTGEKNATPILKQLFVNRFDVNARSPFAASSGRGDVFKSATDLIDNATIDLGIDAARLPFFDGRARLDGAILTFFVYQSLPALMRGHGLTEMDAYDTTNGFINAVKAAQKALVAIGATGALVTKFTEAVDALSKVHATMFRTS